MGFSGVRLIEESLEADRTMFGTMVEYINRPSFVALNVGPFFLCGFHVSSPAAGALFALWDGALLHSRVAPLLINGLVLSDHEHHSPYNLHSCFSNRRSLTPSASRNNCFLLVSGGYLD